MYLPLSLPGHNLNFVYIYYINTKLSSSDVDNLSLINFMIFFSYSGGFVPKDPPDGTLYVPDKYRTTTERVSVQTTVHFDELVVGHQPPGSGNLWRLVFY